MKKFRQNPLYKNLVFLLALIIICSFLVRILLSGETLSDYAKVNGISETVTSYHDVSGNGSESSFSSADSPSASFSVSGAEPDISNNTSGTVSPETSSLGSEDASTDQKDFYAIPINEQIKSRITGVSFPSDSSGSQVKLDDLRYLHLLYYNFNQKKSVGELICNKSIAPDLLSIFRALYENHYEIDKIQLIDDFQGNDELSMENDNTACFNYRAISGTNSLSKHSFGLAVDINPFYNPEITYSANKEISSIQPDGSNSYAVRSSDTPHEISHSDLAYQLFTKYGFKWGGDWKTKKDYQHFEK